MAPLLDAAALTLADPVRACWSVHATLDESPSPRVNASLVADGERLLLFGGYSIDDVCCLRDLWVLSLASDAWRCVEPPEGTPAPAPRSGHTAVVLRRSMVVFGGMNGARFLNDVHELDLQTLTWAEFEPPAGSDSPAPRRGHTSTVFQGSMYVFGGIGREGPFGDMWRLARTRQSFRWSQVEVSGQGPQVYDHDAVLWDRSLFVFGGVDARHNAASAAVYCFSLHTHTWTNIIMIGDIVLQPRSRHQCVRIGHKVGKIEWRKRKKKKEKREC